ncbi:MAG: LPS-assembly protein LptD [Chitinivibrionia bacterium]|nr:LPS-assembly protein LptD [Chitinivibrionia bacterium]
MNVFRASLLCATAAVLAAAPGAGSQERGRSPRGRSAGADSGYYVSAGGTTRIERGGEQVLNLSDGVKIVHGNVTITSLSGIQYAKRGVTFLIGDVEISQESLLMQGEECEYRKTEDLAVLKRDVKIFDQGWDIECDKALLYRTSERLWLVGGVRAADSTTTLEADSLFYDRRLLTAEVFGRVRITNLDEGFTVEGGHGFYYRNSREGLVDRDPRLTVDPESAEPAVVVGDAMRFYPDRREASSFGRVRIIKGETVTQCDSAVVFDEIRKAELYGSPLARQGRSSMKGDRMILGYTGSEVDRIRIEGNAAIREEQADTLVAGRDSRISGDTMLLYLRQNELDSIAVKGNCVSEYYPAGARKIESNFARGDSMFFEFEADTLSYVHIIGTADGAYKYLDLKPGETCDSLRAAYDSSLAYVPFRDKAEKVAYSAKRIAYRAGSRTIVLEGDSKLYYQRRTLLSESITYDLKLQLLDARGTPVLIEESDKFYGNVMDYDLDSGVGLVKEGSTQFQEGYYFGRDVAKVGDDMLKVWNSTYTTCNLKEPHYHLASRQMKVYLRDKVISGPIWLYIGNTPIAFLPFMANNLTKGRRSGILRPDFEFGITKSSGRFIRNVGYYWATNDYTDFTFMGDFNEDASFRFLVENRYKLRYTLDGGVRFSFFRNLSNFTNEWMLSSNHRQTLGEKFDFTSDLRFVSSDRAPRSISRIDQVADVVDRRIESKLSVRKSWNTVGFSASGRRVQQLNVEDPAVVRVGTTLPDISLSIPSRSLYFGSPTAKGEKSFWEKFLGGIRYSPAVSGRRTTEERKYVYTETINQNVSLGFSSPWKISFVTVSPRLSASNAYTRIAKDVAAHTEIGSSFGVPDTTVVAGGKTVDSDNVFAWSTGASARTNLYGTFYPGIGALSGIRHTLTPSVSYSYNPRVGSRQASEGYSVSLTNAVDLKVRSGEQEKKVSNVLIWDVSANYNPRAPKRQGWSTVASRVNLKIFGTNVSMNQSIQPYTGEILSTSITSFLDIRGSHPFGGSRDEEAPVLNVVAGDTAQAGGDADDRPGESEREESAWNIGMAYSYAKSSYGESRATLNMNSAMRLTKSWRLTYSTTYDLTDRMFLGQSFTINRDLHCWEMSFSRQKLGEEWQYYFRINIKAHTEVYAESGRRGLSGGGYGLSSFY